jgi:hypothetical protein
VEKAKGRLLVWDRKDERFLVCDELMHSIFYGAKTLEEIERYTSGAGQG